MSLQSRILIAVVFGLVLVTLAFLVPKTGKTPTETNLQAKPEKNTHRVFIAVTDNDKDGIPDWKNNLAVGDTVFLPDGPYEPSSETGKFAARIVESLIYASSTDSEEILEEFKRDNDSTLATSSYSLRDMNLTGKNDPDSLYSLGNEVANILLTPSPGQGLSETEILDQVLDFDNYEKLTELDPIINTYEKTIVDLLNLPVSSESAPELLAIIQSLDLIKNNLIGFKSIENDALVAVAHISAYPVNSSKLYTSVVNFYQKMSDLGIKWKEGDVVLKLITVD